MTQALKHYYAEVNQYYRRNFVAALVDNAMFAFISLGLSPYTVLPFYLTRLTDSRLLIGLIPAINILGFSLPQLLMARFLRGKPRKKIYLVIAAVVQRVGILAFLLLTLIQNSLPNNLTIALFFVLYIIQSAATGFWFPTWADFIGRAIPHRRGMLFGVSNFIGGVLSIGGGWLLGYFLDVLPYPSAITAIAACALVASLISLVAILSWHEAVPPESTEFTPQSSQAPNSAQYLHNDADFRNYLLWGSVIIIVQMALPFYSLHALEELRLADAQVGIFTMILSVSQTVMNPLWGWLGDKKGYLNITIISAISGSLGALLAANAHSLPLFYLVFWFAGTMISGLQLANLNIIYEFSPAAEVPMYAAISNLVLSPLSGIAPLIGGFLTSHFGYALCFWVAGLIGSAGTLGLVINVRNPKERTLARPSEIREEGSGA